MLSFLLLIMVTRKLNVMKTNQLKRNPWTSGWKTWFSKHATCHRFTAPVLCLAGLSVEVIDTICSEGEVTDHILPSLYKPWEPEWDQEGLYLFIISPLNHQGIMLSTVTVLSAPAAHFIDSTWEEPETHEVQSHLQHSWEMVIYHMCWLQVPREELHFWGGTTIPLLSRCTC